jgi:hypothetical protein
MIIPIKINGSFVSNLEVSDSCTLDEAAALAYDSLKLTVVTVEYLEGPEINFITQPQV